GAARTQRAVDDIGDQLLEQLARDLALVAPALIFEFDVRERHEREPLLGLDHGPAQELDGLAVPGKILAPFGLDIFETNPDPAIVDVIAAQMRVPVGSQHLEDSVMELQNRNIEGAAAEVVHGDNS